jgi:hypothetical protein
MPKRWFLKLQNYNYFSKECVIYRERERIESIPPNLPKLGTKN